MASQAAPAPNDPAATCPECGAPQVAGFTCWEQLGAVLAWEWQDPELQAVHFLTVAAYNLQHPAQFTDEALQALRAQFIAHLDRGVSVAEIRREVGRAAAGATRVLKPLAARHPVLRLWPLTVASVYLPDHPEGAAARVKAWAASIRQQML
jgi:hypothetical protein